LLRDHLTSREEEAARRGLEAKLEKVCKAVARLSEVLEGSGRYRSLEAKLEKISKAVARPSDVQGGRGR
jgi:hypothetical protein